MVKETVHLLCSCKPCRKMNTVSVMKSEAELLLRLVFWQLEGKTVSTDKNTERSLCVF